MIAGIVLAAGQGQRIGGAKAWLRTGRGEECFFGRACGLLAGEGAHPVVGVIGSGGESRAHRAAPGAVLVVNPSPDEGQLSSLQLGLRVVAVFDPDAEAVLVLPVDVPLVSGATVCALIDRWRESRMPVVRPVSRDGQHGHPVLFGGALFEGLLNADPAVGAKPIVRAHISPAGDVLVEDDGAFLDIDTAEDYIRTFKQLPERIG